MVADAGYGSSTFDDALAVSPRDVPAPGPLACHAHAQPRLRPGLWSEGLRPKILVCREALRLPAQPYALLDHTVMYVPKV